MPTKQHHRNGVSNSTSDNIVIVEQRGANYCFQLPRWIPREDYLRITDLPDVWYYKENQHFYFKHPMLSVVQRVLVELGFSTKLPTTMPARIPSVPQNSNTPSPQNGTHAEEDAIPDTSKIVDPNLKIVSKIAKLFNLKSRYICPTCQKRVRWNGSARGFSCPQHGLLNRGRKIWYFTGTLNFDGEEQLTLLVDECFTGLLKKIGMRKQDVVDAVKGLRGELYYQQLKEIKEKIVARIAELDREYGFVGELIEWKTGGETVVFFNAKKTMTEREMATLQGAEKFIAGEFETIKQLATEILPDYDLTVKNFGDIPVVLLKKQVGEDVIAITIRAPVGEYGKAYRLSLRVNDVLMFPASPVEVSVWGQIVRIWAWRVFHTKGWETNLRERIEYIRKMEPRAIAIVNRMRVIREFAGRDLLADLDLPAKVKTDILGQWTDGNTLLEFCHLIAYYDPSKALQAFQKAVQFIYKMTYGRWLVEEVNITDADLADITLASKRVTS